MATTQSTTLPTPKNIVEELEHAYVEALTIDSIINVVGASNLASIDQGHAEYFFDALQERSIALATHIDSIRAMVSRSLPEGESK